MSIIWIDASLSDNSILLQKGSLLNALIGALRFNGRKSNTWLLIGIVSSILLVSFELGIASFIQIFIVNLGLLDKSHLPETLQVFGVMTNINLCLVLILLGFMRSVGVFFSQQSSQVFNQMIIARLRFLTIHELITNKDYATIPVTDIHHRFGEIFHNAGAFVRLQTQLIVSIIVGSSVFFGMLYNAPYETLIGVGLLSLIGLIVKNINKKIYLHSEETIPISKNITKSVERICRNWVLVKISKTQNYEYIRMFRYISSYFHHYVKKCIYTQFLATIPSFVGVVAIAVLILLSREYFSTSASVLISFLYLFLRFVQQVSQSFHFYSDSVSFLPHYKICMNIFENFNSTSVNSILEPIEKMKVISRFSRFADVNNSTCSKLTEHRSWSAPSKIPAICIQRISFSWPSAKKKLFSDFSLDIKPGESLGILGPSGCGKSTLLYLILGVLRPNEGSCSIDAIESMEYLERHSNSIGYVGADPFLFSGTIRENLLYGNRNEEIANQEIFAALDKAGILSFIQDHFQGLDYYLTENAEGLSTGQKQRIALARAFLKQPKLLILDEATANLDLATESKISESIKKNFQFCTKVIVSHRLNMLKNCDRVIDLGNPNKKDDGRNI